MGEKMKRSRKSNSRQRNKTSEDVLKEINRDYVKIKKKDRKFNNELLFAVLEELLGTMTRCNELFRSMRPRLEYLGSYFDGLRVGQPNEYDINVILKLPVNDKKIQLDATMSSNDCTSVVMPSDFRRLLNTPNTGFSKTGMWCDTRYRLSVKKFRSWMQTVIDEARAKLSLRTGKPVIYVNNNCCQIETKMSGPAYTITIIIANDSNKIIDIDLVPTFEFILPKKPNNSNVIFDNAECMKLKQYYVVPKPSENDFSWRISFPIQERLYIYDKNNLKSTLKLLKLLRDVQGFKQLASYYIKTIFLWEIKVHDEEFWKNNSLSYLLIYMLKKLRDCLAIGEIKNFWCPEANLIQGKVKIETCRNWSNRLSFIIHEIEHKSKDNPQILLQYFTRQ